MAVGLFFSRKKDVAPSIRSGTYKGELKVTKSTAYPFDTLSVTSTVDCILTFNQDGTGFITYLTDEDPFTWDENLTLQKNYTNDIEIVDFAYITLVMEWPTYGYGADTLDLPAFDLIYEYQLQMEKQ